MTLFAFYTLPVKKHDDICTSIWRPLISTTSLASILQFFWSSCPFLLTVLMELSQACSHTFKLCSKMLQEIKPRALWWPLWNIHFAVGLYRSVRYVQGRCPFGRLLHDACPEMLLLYFPHNVLSSWFYFMKCAHPCCNRTVQHVRIELSDSCLSVNVTSVFIFKPFNFSSIRPQNKQHRH